MPIWEYRCSECEKQFEQIVLREPERTECPHCGGTKLEKLIPTFAVSTASGKRSRQETGPCPCGAPQRGMCSN